MDGDSALPYHDALLDAVRAMHEGRATATAEQVDLLGIAVQGGAWDTALAALRSKLPAGIELDMDVFVINPAPDKRVMCRQMFIAVTRAPIGFQQSGDRIRTASYAALDRLAEFAADCRDHAITIVGHSDSTGDAAFNIDLSRRRAQSVADYLSARGVAGTRLLVEGAGSSQPVGDNATSFGRRQNRRIEFRLVAPPPD